MNGAFCLAVENIVRNFRHMTMNPSLMGALVLSGAVFSSTILPAHETVEPGFKSLFTRKDLPGRAGRPNHWSGEECAITGITSKDNPAQGYNFLLAKSR